LTSACPAFRVHYSSQNTSGHADAMNTGAALEKMVAVGGNGPIAIWDLQ
jgi:hypothetical protein